MIFIVYFRIYIILYSSFQTSKFVNMLQNIHRFSIFNTLYTLYIIFITYDKTNYISVLEGPNFLFKERTPDLGV